MKTKIIGLFVCMLVIVPVLPIVSAGTVQASTALTAGLITIEINAKVDEVEDPHNLLNNVIKVNATIGGKYIYDSGTPDSLPDSSVWGRYDMTSSSCKFVVNAGGLVFKTNPSAVEFRITIANGYWSTDGYLVESNNNLQLSNGMLVIRIYWGLTDMNESFFSSDALPTTAPVPLTAWEANTLVLVGENPSNPDQDYAITAHVTNAKKSIAGDTQGTINETPGNTIPFHYNLLFKQFWMRIVERFPNAFPILRHLMGY